MRPAIIIAGKIRGRSRMLLLCEQDIGLGGHCWPCSNQLIKFELLEYKW
jgi:hypothetical protein